MEEQREKLDRQRGVFRFTRNEVVVLVIGSTLALGSLRADDPLVIVPTLAIAWIAFLYVCIVHAGPRSYRTVAAVGITAVMGFVGYRILHGKAEPTGLTTLTNDQRKRFMEALGAQPQKLTVELMCPPASERECIVAAQFVTVFEQSGWPVQGRIIERVAAGNPQDGLYFVLHSTANPDISKPGQGAWTKIPPGLATVDRAFRELAIIPKPTQISADYPENKLGIYFGEGTARR